MNPNDQGDEFSNLPPLDESIPIEPADELWFPDEPIPDDVLAKMPKEENLFEAMGYLFPEGVPEGLGLTHMRGMANYWRQVIWKKFKEKES